MQFIPVSNTARIDFVYSLGGQIVTNTFHVKKATPFDSEEMSIVAGLASDTWKATLRLWHSTGVVLNLVRATDLTTQTSPGYELSVIAGNAGDVPGEICPNNVSLAFTMTTGLRGRSYRGRWYWAGINVTHVDNNIASSTFVAGAITEFGDFLSAFNLANYVPVVVSKYSNNAPRAAGVATPIDGVRCDGIIDSQRKRLPGRGK